MLFPARLPVPSAMRKTIARTFKQVAARDASNASCWACVIAAQAARLGDHRTAWKIFKDWGGTGRNADAHMTITEDWLNPHNSLMNWRGKAIMQIDGTTAYPGAVNETLLLSEGTVIKVFPAVPKSFSGAYHGLRTANGFLVSSRMEKGRIKDIVVKSLFGGRCELSVESMPHSVRIGDLSGGKVAAARKNGIILFDSQAGHTYSITIK
jgi:hypothetical protein